MTDSENPSEFDTFMISGVWREWNVLIERHGEKIVEIGQEVMPNEPGIERCHRYEVIEQYLKTKSQSKFKPAKNGVRVQSEQKSRLNDAIEAAAKEGGVGTERIEQSCRVPYDADNSPKIDQFLRDLCEVEERLSERCETDDERDTESYG